MGGQPSSKGVPSMESSAPTQVLVVAHKTAATPALLQAVRDRAARGPCEFTLLVPNAMGSLDRVMDPEDQAATQPNAVLSLALRLMGGAAGSRVLGLVGAPAPLTAIQDAVNRDGYDE